MKELFRFKVGSVVVTGWLPFNWKEKTKWQVAVGFGRYDSHYDLDLLLISLMFETGVTDRQWALNKMLRS